MQEVIQRVIYKGDGVLHVTTNMRNVFLEIGLSGDEWIMIPTNEAGLSFLLDDKTYALLQLFCNEKVLKSDSLNFTEIEEVFYQ